MNEYNLIQFEDKFNLRKLLQSQSVQVKYSSIYKLNNKFYVLLFISEFIKSENTIDFKQYDELDTLEKILYQWAKSEIEQTLEFINFESKTSFIQNGRELNVNGVIITRTFEFLTDIFAILNFTHDSFSDGGKFKSLDDFYAMAVSQVEFGAKVLDIGVESTNPNSKPLTADEEIKKLKSILPELINLKKIYQFKISIDTYHNKTMCFLLDKEVDIINDVSGKAEINLVKQIVSNNKKYLAMHSLSVPASKDKVTPIDANPVKVIYNWMFEKINSFSDVGIPLNQIILDPGIGFGNTPTQAWFILRNFSEFNKMPCELLLGHSRKSFFSHINNKKASARDLETMLVALKFINKLENIRVHDVRLITELYPVIHQLQ